MHMQMDGILTASPDCTSKQMRKGVSPLDSEIQQLAGDILNHPRFQQLRDFQHHGESNSVYDHSVAVAEAAYAIARLYQCDINVVLATHNATTVTKARALREEQLAQGEQRTPLVFAQLQGMADEVSCSLIAACRDKDGPVGPKPQGHSARIDRLH